MDFIKNIIQSCKKLFEDKLIFLTFLLVVIGLITLFVGIGLDNIEKLLNSIQNNIIIFFLIILLLIVIVLYILHWHQEQENVPLYRYSNNPEFIGLLKPLIKDGSTIRFLSYTNETITNYIQWDEMHDLHITIKILMRDWNVECDDEINHNNLLQQIDPDRTRWKKASIIYTHSNDLINGAGVGANIDIRFYKGYPIFKGIIIETPDHIKYAFLGLFHWVRDTSMKDPPGGSQYVGNKAPVVFLRSNRGDLENDLIKRFESQFERLWRESLQNDFNTVSTARVHAIPNPRDQPCR